MITFKLADTHKFGLTLRKINFTIAYEINLFQAKWTDLWNSHWQEVYDAQFKIFVQSKTEELRKERKNKLEEDTCSLAENAAPKNKIDLCSELDKLAIETNPNDNEEKTDQKKKENASIEANRTRLDENADEKKKKEKENWQRSSCLQGVGHFLQLIAADSNETKTGESQSSTNKKSQCGSEGKLF